MKRVSTVLAAVVMMVGAFGGVGCKKASSLAEADKPVEQQTEATTDTASNAGTQDEATATVAASVQIPAPPALRTENPGRAPSARHVWQRGFWRWDRAAYAWVPGHWEYLDAYAPYAPPAARYEDPGYAPSVEYFFVPGFWRWGGVEYVWVYGHWSHRRDAGYYYRPTWENRNGRWGHRMDRWDDHRVQAWEREHPRQHRPEGGNPGPRGGHAGADQHPQPPQHGGAGQHTQPPQHAGAGQHTQPPQHAGAGQHAQPPQHAQPAAKPADVRPRTAAVPAPRVAPIKPVSAKPAMPAFQPSLKNARPVAASRPATAAAAPKGASRR